MATNSNLRRGVPGNALNKNRFSSLRSPGLFAKRPILGLILFLLGSVIFSLLAFNLKDNSSLIHWDVATAKSLHGTATSLASWIIEYILFGFFIGKEIVILIGIIFAIYFLYKRFWRELAMVLIGLGGGSAIWYFLDHYFDRPRPAPLLPKILALRDFSFPSGSALAAILCYGLLAYLLVPRLPSRFWKWVVGLALTLVIVFVGLSGLFLGNLYVTDVIAGYALGFAWAGLIYTLMERSVAEGAVRNRENVSSTPSSEGLRSPGLFARRPIVGVILILLGGLAFAALSYNLVTNGPLVQVDMSVHNQFLADAKAGSPLLNEIMLFGFFFGKQLVQVVVAILLIYFIYKRYWPEFAMLIISSPVGSLLWNFIIRYFNRPRPVEQTGLPITTIPSYPSGHAMSALICYGFLAYLLVPKMPSRFWKWTLSIVTLLLVLFDGFSRVFQGNHYLTDVLSGYALGIVWAALVYTLIEIIFIRKKA
jgi:undecaprenyl-diphosphatase